MGGSGLQWSFSGQSDKPSQLLSFKPASELGNHSIYAPGFVQNAVSAEKMMTSPSPSPSTTAIAAQTSSFVSRQTQIYGGLVDKSRARMVASPLKNSPSSVLSNGVGCRVNNTNPHESVYKLPSNSAPPLSSAIVGSTNLSSGESSFNGPSQMTIFYNGLVCVYEDVAPDKAQAIMLLAGNGNSGSRKQAEPVAKPPAKNDVASVNPSSSIYSKPIPVPAKNEAAKSSIYSKSIPIPVPSSPTDLSVSKPKDQIPASNCTSTVEVNARNSAPKFQPPRTCSPPANQIRRSQPVIDVDMVSSGVSTSKVDVTPKASAFPTSNQIHFHHSSIQVDPVSSGVSTSKVDVTPKTSAPTFPTSNQINFHHSANPVNGVPASASTNKVEVNPRNPPLRHPSPTSRFRFSPSAVTIDPVLAAASISKLDNPSSKFTSPATGSPVSNQYRFSPPATVDPVLAAASIRKIDNLASKFTSHTTGSPVSNQYRFSPPVPPRSSTGRFEVHSSNPAAIYPPPAPDFVGANQFRFSQSVGASSTAIDVNPKISSSNLPPPAPTQIRFSRSAHPVEHGTASSPINIVESNPVKPTSKFSDHANQYRFTHSANPVVPSSPGASNSNPVERNSTNFPAPTTTSGTNQFRFSHSDSFRPSLSAATANKPASEPNQFCFSKPGMPPSYMERSSASGSSTPELVKPVPPAITVDRASPGPSNTNVEASEPSNSPAPAKASGDANQLRFSHTGVPLARKASLARFMEKRKERPQGEVGDIPIPPSKYRSNSR